MTQPFTHDASHCATQSSALRPCNDHGTVLPTVLSGSSPILVPLKYFFRNYNRTGIIITSQHNVYLDNVGAVPYSHICMWIYNCSKLLGLPGLLSNLGKYTHTLFL